MDHSLVLTHLSVFTSDGIPIVHDVSLTVKPGEIHALMGPNGSGKSTLALALAGAPGYTTKGEISLDGTSLNKLSPDKRSRAGLFLGFQHPIAVSGVSISAFLRAAVHARRPDEKLSVMEFHKLLMETAQRVGLDPKLLERSLNEGFSGGERKKLEIVQLLLLKPRFAILDETDSGLDVDALRTVAEGIRSFASPETGVFLITHYQRLLTLVEPQFVHVLAGGTIVAQGDAELAKTIEKTGYEVILRKAVHAPAPASS